MTQKQHSPEYFLTTLAALVAALFFAFTEKALSQAVSLQSVNFPDHYVRHSNFQVLISPISSDLDKKDASFKKVPGLAGGGTVSFESVNFPGFFLRHQNYAFVLQQNDGSGLFAKDASFREQSGLAGSGASFEAVNFPGYYMRHQNFAVKLQPFDSATVFRLDASFNVVPGLAGSAAGGGDRPFSLFPETYTVPVSLPKFDFLIDTGQVSTGFLEVINSRPVLVRYFADWIEVMPDGSEIGKSWASGTVAIGYHNALFMKNAKNVRLYADEATFGERLLERNWATPPNRCVELYFSDAGPCSASTMSSRFGSIGNLMQVYGPAINTIIDHFGTIESIESMEGKSLDEIAQIARIGDLVARLNALNLFTISDSSAERGDDTPLLVSPVFRPEVDGAFLTSLVGSKTIRRGASGQGGDNGELRAVTLGWAANISLIGGGAVSGGYAFSTKGQDNAGFRTLSWSVGASASINSGPSLGFYFDDPKKLAGNAQGVTVGAAYVAGTAITFWRDYADKPEDERLLGIDVTFQVGMGADAEYARSNTCVSGSHCPDFWD